MSTAIPVAVIGATGYAGEGTVKILLGHPGFTLVHVGSDRLAGRPLAEAVPELAGQTDLILGKDDYETVLASGCKAVVLAKKSPEITSLVPKLVAGGVRIVDIGAEFRLRDHDDYKTWYGDQHACPELLTEAVYGLSEIETEAVAAAQVVGNPGCYATSILLPLIPLLEAQLIDRNGALSAIGYSGLSGAGKKFIEKNNNLFYAMNENLHSYRAVGHQHTGELDQALSKAAGEPTHVSFVPHLAPITRGIHTTITATLADGVDLEQVFAAWQKRYHTRAFIRVRDNCRAVELGHVTGSNFSDFSAEADGRTLIIASVIDNLVKGASGQAVQNLNIMYGFNEKTGLVNRGI